jgi:hypothetical protein
MKMAISEQQRERLEQLASKSDSDIDAVDIPEVRGGPQWTLQAA